MSTYTQILYHIVFSTKERVPCLSKSHREDLYRYIWGIIKNKKCSLIRINGVEDHLHILTTLHPSICLADFVKDIKTSSTLWIKENKIFPTFVYWQEGYGAFTCSNAEKPAIVDYIINQEEHHKRISFADEMRKLLIEHRIEFDERYFLG